jgi:hypothetical protein
MATKRYKAEQIMALLRQLEVVIANGQTTPKPAGKLALVITTPPWSISARSRSTAIF